MSTGKDTRDFTVMPGHCLKSGVMYLQVSMSNMTGASELHVRFWMHASHHGTHSVVNWYNARDASDL